MKRKIIILLAIALPLLLLVAGTVCGCKSKSRKTVAQATLDVSKDAAKPEKVNLPKEEKRRQTPLKNLSHANQDKDANVQANDKSLDEGVGLEQTEDAARKSLEEEVGLELDEDDEQKSLDEGDELEQEDSEDAKGIEVVPSGNRYALLIGVNEYAKPIKPLHYCVNDMKLLSDSFVKGSVPKENIILVTDDSPAGLHPTGANIRQQLELVTQLMGPHDQLIVAFSGHGAMVDGKSYLCPSDTNLNDKNSVISREWAFSQLEKCKAKQKVFIIDACRNEVSFGEQRDLGGAKTLDDPIGADAHGFLLIASCDKSQMSWEHSKIKHGVFTYFLAEGLAGAARDEDGFVSIMNLFQYASSQTKKYVYHEFSKAQVPTFRQGGEMTDFVIAKLNILEPISNPESRTLVYEQPSRTFEKKRKVFSVNGVKFAFCWCPPGSFMMGSPETEEGRDSNEQQHQVYLTPGFWMMETEVTQKQWTAIMGDNPSEFKGDDLPVENVSWEDCQEFCKKCTAKGLPVQLPTEEQWEYACRAGTTSAYFWGDALNGDKANCNGEIPSGTSVKGKKVGKTTPVKSYESNALGLYDMHGNVWEWCNDFWDRDYKGKDEKEFVNPLNITDHVIRGGSWDWTAWDSRSACRNHYPAKSKNECVGFRVVKVE